MESLDKRLESLNKFLMTLDTNFSQLEQNRQIKLGELTATAEQVLFYSKIWF